MSAPQKESFPITQPPGFGFYLLAGTIIVLCLQGIIYLLLVANTIGPFNFFRAPQPPDPALLREMKVALVRSEASARMFPENPESYYAHERHWESILKRQRIPFQVISEAQLAAGAGDAAVVVLPSAACLGEAQRKAILDFLAAGKGVVASGALGTRNQNCVWQGWGFLSNLAGIRNISSLTPSSTIYVGFGGQLFFSEKVPAGYRLEIPSQEITLAAADQADAFWSDWMLRPAQGDSVSNVALAIHGRHAAGRIVWYGFDEYLPVERPIEQTLLDHYLMSAARWVGKQPLAILGNWPNRKKGAALIAQNVEEDFGDAQGSANLLKQEAIPGIFLCDAADAKRYVSMVKTFAAQGEVASAGDTLEPFGGQLSLRQEDRLRQAKQDLERITGGKVLGFAPPLGLVDTATVVALNDAGYRYYLNEMAVSRAVPEIVEFTGSVFFPFQKNEVLKVFRTSSDDIEVLANYHGPANSPSGLAESFLSDFRRISGLGGVYTLSFHSYLLGSPEFREALGRVVENIKSQPVWITTGQSLVDWWVARNKVQAQASKLGIHRIRLDVANMGLADLEEASVYLYLPYHPQKVNMGSTVFRLRPPRFQMLEPDNILRVDFPRLSAQTNYTYVVGLDE